MRRAGGFLATVTSILVLIACAHAAPTAPPSPSPRANSQPNSAYAAGAPALWSRELIGAGNAIIDGNVAVVQIWRLGNSSATQAFDVRSGILASGKTIEFVDVRTGAMHWRSARACQLSASYAAVIGARVYVGCSDGNPVSLLTSTGHIEASTHFDVDRYDVIEKLHDGLLDVEGYASVGMFRRSAVLRPDTLSTVVAFDPGSAILRVDKPKRSSAIRVAAVDIATRGPRTSNGSHSQPERRYRALHCTRTSSR